MKTKRPILKANLS